MAAKRKQQADIDFTVKNIQEGLEEYRSWGRKLEAATKRDDMKEKEKLLAEMKRELKKLQRLRDQVRNWLDQAALASNQALLDARRAVEVEMENFKTLERETKMKNFSKAALLLGDKLEPEEEAKINTASWIQDAKQRLEIEVEKFEADVDAARAKGSADEGKIMELEHLIEQHNHHCARLEQVLRLLENDQVTAEQVDDALKDGIEYYLDSSSEAGFVADETMYDDLPLEEVANVGKLNAHTAPHIPLKQLLADEAGEKSGDSGHSVKAARARKKGAKREAGKAQAKKQKQATAGSAAKFTAKTPPPPIKARSGVPDSPRLATPSSEQALANLHGSPSSRLASGGLLQAEQQGYPVGHGPLPPGVAPEELTLGPGQGLQYPPNPPGLAAQRMAQYRSQQPLPPQYVHDRQQQLMMQHMPAPQAPPGAQHMLQFRSQLQQSRQQQGRQGQRQAGRLPDTLMPSTHVNRPPQSPDGRKTPKASTAQQAQQAQLDACKSPPLSQVLPSFLLQAEGESPDGKDEPEKEPASPTKAAKTEGGEGGQEEEKGEGRMWSKLPPVEEYLKALDLAEGAEPDSAEDHPTMRWITEGWVMHPAYQRALMERSQSPWLEGIDMSGMPRRSAAQESFAASPRHKSPNPFGKICSEVRRPWLEDNRYISLAERERRKQESIAASLLDVKPHYPAPTDMRPDSYPASPEGIPKHMEDPKFLEQLVHKNGSLEMLFFTFYFQPETLQQLYATKLLNQYGWVYHKQYLRWFHHPRTAFTPPELQVPAATRTGQ
ncbi:hypothetical protein WJX72_002698 [[Myrmecia] bisecta]|uniref:CCR4-NOT transcription complex subunit 3 n=1 Tax=[Myrmecia] bisecta TaxID=41462 RepID=A0AAW1QQA1_9CHLO